MEFWEGKQVFMKNYIFSVLNVELHNYPTNHRCFWRYICFIFLSCAHTHKFSTCLVLLCKNMVCVDLSTLAGSWSKKVTQKTNRFSKDANKVKNWTIRFSDFFLATYGDSIPTSTPTRISIPYIATHPCPSPPHTSHINVKAIRERNHLWYGQVLSRRYEKTHA